GRVRSKPFFGLPGNPVAVFVTFVTLVRPALLKLQGAAAEPSPLFPARADFSLEKPGSRQEYLRVRLRREQGGAAWLEPYPEQGSSILSSLSWADGLVIVPPAVTVRRGDSLNYLPFSAL